MKVLVVEDEKGLAESITDYMGAGWYICETATVRGGRRENSPVQL